MLSKLSKEISELSDTLIPNYKFIYMNSFKDVLVDKILIDDIDKNKTVLNFLDIAEIKKEEIINAVESDDQQQIRTIENKTVSVVTQHFKKIFSQVKDDQYFKISMTIDSKNRALNFWIQNKITGEAVLPFSAESEGMQWYLSMYLRLYEYFNNIEENTKYILLLDEPNIYLHAEAQYDLLNNVFKQKLRDVQIIYSTHSPYMIDAEDLYSLRIVDKDDGTKIFNMTIDYLKFKRRNEKIGDVDVLSPALIATGINISNQLTISPSDKIIVVEGPHDYYMLSAMKEILKINDNDIKIIPCHGATKVPFMCSYLYGLGYNIVALLDNDTDGRKAMKELSFENEDLDFIKVLLYSKKDNDSNNCILEDLFSEDDRIKYMPQKSTVNYRTIYDSRSNIKLDSETKSNFKNIFKFINDSFK
jgi:predicted ATP-dependent endonuclease of OLD family